MEGEVTEPGDVLVVHAGPRPMTRSRVQALIDDIPPERGALVIDLSGAAFIAEDAAVELCEFVVREILERDVILAAVQGPVRRELLACGLGVVAPIVSSVEQAAALVRRGSAAKHPEQRATP